MEFHGGSRFLLTCAMTRYEHCPEWNLPELAEDIDRVAELFSGRFLPAADRYEHIKALGDSPTSVELLDRLRKFCTAQERRTDDYIVMYLAGHGEILEGGDHVILTSDTSPADLLHRSVPTAEIVRMALANTKVRRFLLLLDTCYAGTGGEDLARESLRRINPYSSRVDKLQGSEENTDDGGRGVVLVAATHRNERAEVGAFTHCLDRAARSPSVAGYAAPTLRMPALIESINSDPDKRKSQSAVCHLLALDSEEPAFLPNPRYRPRLVGVDLLEQERARHAEQRAGQLRDRFLPAIRWFTGRRDVLTDLAQWLRNPAVTHNTAIVTGNAGSGKTALLGLLAALSDPDQAPAVPVDALPAEFTLLEGTICEAIYAGTMTTSQVRERIAAAVGLLAETTQQLIDGLNAKNIGTTTILIDAIDEAANPQGLISELLNPLIRQRPGNIKLLLGTRPHLLSSTLLGKRDSGHYVLLDVDSERYADPDGIRRYIKLILLSDDSLDSAYRPSRIYHDADERIVDGVIEAIGQAAGKSFLVARITATTEATATILPNPEDSTWRQGLPRRAGPGCRGTCVSVWAWKRTKPKACYCRWPTLRVAGCPGKTSGPAWQINSLLVTTTTMTT